MINQLFNNKPSIQLIEKLINIIGFESIYTNRKVFKNDLEKKNIVVKFNNIINDIKYNYLDCKKKYCDNLTISKCITITKQHLKTINYDIVSEYAYLNSKRYITYRIVKSNIKKNINKKLKFVISFEN
jgi:hypothetical protein